MWVSAVRRSHISPGSSDMIASPHIPDTKWVLTPRVAALLFSPPYYQLTTSTLELTVELLCCDCCELCEYKESSYLRFK